MKSTSLRQEYKFSSYVCEGLFYASKGEPSKDESTGEVKFFRHYVFSESFGGVVALHVPPKSENAMAELPPWTPIKLVDGDLTVFASDGSKASDNYLTKYYTCSDFMKADSSGSGANTAGQKPTVPPASTAGRDYKPVDKPVKPEDNASK